MTFGNAWRQSLLWTLECLSSYLCVRAHTVEMTCVWRMCTRVRSNKWIWERVCVRCSSPGLCFSCRVSPICHGLYLVRRSQPKQHGRRFRETWAWKEVSLVTEMCCEQDDKNWGGGNVSRGRGGSRRGREPSKHSTRTLSYRSTFNSAIVCVKWTKDHKRLVWM